MGVGENMQSVYADNAASTCVRQEVLNFMALHQEDFGNPSCFHAMGRKSRELIENARNQIAHSIGAKPNEIIFTSDGTESNNLAIQGYANANRGRHIITTAIEHMSVLKPIEYLYRKGCDVTVLEVDKYGIIDLQQLQNSIRKNTMLISIMFANNEIGTIQSINEIGKIAKEYGICFHTDAVQAIGHCDIDVKKQNIDMMSISAHKIYAPKGIGFLYAKDNIRLQPLLYGGGQEYGLRSGTENVNAIVGMGKAIELLSNKEQDILFLKMKLLNGIKSMIQGIRLNGAIENSLPSILNISIDGIDGAILADMLSYNDIYVSSGAACTTGISRPSHVLKAIGLSDKEAYSSLRFSFGIYNTENDINYILDVLPELVNKLRSENNSVDETE